MNEEKQFCNAPIPNQKKSFESKRTLQNRKGRNTLITLDKNRHITQPVV